MKNLQTAILTSRICINSSVSYLDPSNYFLIFGLRQSLFSIINPTLFRHSLKTSFLLIESFIKNKYKFIIITNIKSPTLFLKFYHICKKKNIFLLKDSETSTGFLTNKIVTNTVILTLFLDTRKTELIQTECARVRVPLISFSDLTANKFSSSIFVCGNFNSFLAQNLILTLLSICFEQKYFKNGNKYNKS